MLVCGRGGPRPGPGGSVTERGDRRSSGGIGLYWLRDELGLGCFVGFTLEDGGQVNLEVSLALLVFAVEVLIPICPAWP